ncbi:uncharacterized protein BCR38DRAFT_406675 [Pseudomassariella vexata]|uniref:Uncharacterized protein n=1 Tax=Pseudomassariella vexata TaxID=1141098 RepID=A0A1Y2EBI6_9PEZI|nr:uncharacterized protein BCR38DRAFT_406675 [Pseudomassariella vexata]ORY68777.1 hypothetical protein BCR38DRAFT_406675 [Pseudomassariella vexata]
MDALRGSSPAKGSANDSPEQLLDIFKTAALSVTKLYKTSAAAQTKARSDGYQDCLDDLLSFLDKQRLGLSDGEGWQIRRWATERLEGSRDAQTAESEDESDKPETVSSPELYRSTNTTSTITVRPEPEMRADSAPPATIIAQTSPAATVSPVTVPQQPPIVVPTQDNFTFQSSMMYPQDSDLNMANLDLSDRNNENVIHQPTSQPRPRNHRSGQRPRTANHLGRGAGQKRKINFAEIFDLGSIGGKDMFGSGGGKRSRHA